MKICVLAKSALKHNYGGMETHLENLVQSLLDLGHQVFIITTSFKSLCEERSKNLYVFYLPRTPSGVYSKKWWRFSKDMFKKLNEKNKFDIVLSQSVSGYSISLIKPHPLMFMIAYGRIIDNIWNELYDCKNIIDYIKFFLIKLPEILHLYIYECKMIKNIDGIIATGETIAMRFKKKKIY